MTPEVVLTHMLPALETLLKAVGEQAVAPDAPPTLDKLAALTQRVLPKIRQVVLQELTRAQGSGLGGPTRVCGCGEEQRYRDQGRRLVVQTSGGDIRLEQRAVYRCGACQRSSRLYTELCRSPASLQAVRMRQAGHRGAHLHPLAAPYAFVRSSACPVRRSRAVRACPFIISASAMASIVGAIA